MRLSDPKLIRLSLVFLGSAILAAALPDRAKAGQERLARLPIGMQTAISGKLGRENRAYHAVPAPGSLCADNERQRLRIEFGREGVSISSGPNRIDLSLLAIGYGGALEAAVGAAPTDRHNRVEYVRGQVIEWYVNGPLGLEQGFTLAAPPGRRTAAPVTLLLSISGDLTASLDEGGKSLILGQGGKPALRYRGLAAFDATGHELSAWLELSSGGFFLRVDDADARYPITIDPLFEAAKLTASDGMADDQLGWRVAVSGDTVVVGARLDDVGANMDQGSAYVFVKPAGGWAGALTEVARLTASDGDAEDWFGSSVAIDGNTVVVGSSRDDVGANSDQGSAYVFVEPAGGWGGVLTETAKLTASDGAADDTFGVDAAVSGDTVVVGSEHHDVGANANQGSAYVFVEPAGGWVGALTETAQLIASDGLAEDRLAAVAIDGDTVLVGAPLAHVNPPQENQGSAYVFLEPPTGWAGTLTEVAKLTTSDGADGDHFGFPISLDGDTAVIGAPVKTFGLNSEQGSAYVFVKPPGGWALATTEAARLAPSNPIKFGFFGQSVAISGDEIVVSALGPFDGPNDDDGDVYLFLKPAGGWSGTLTETLMLDASDAEPDDRFGESVAVSGRTVVVGATFDDVGPNLHQGSAYVFDFIPYTFLGFLPPLPNSSSFNSGSTIPVKFMLGDANGTPISDAEAQALAASCGVQIFFTGGNPSPNCAIWNGTKFQFNLKTSKNLLPGIYTITVKVFVGGSEVTAAPVNVLIQ